MSGVSNVCLFDFTTRFYNFVSAFQKLPKIGTEIIHACDSFLITGCTSITFAFILWRGII